MYYLAFFLIFAFYSHGDIPREFDQIPYALDCRGSKEEGFLIKCYDWQDKEFGSEGVPFLIMEIKEEAEIVELGRTANFSGKKIVALALQLKREFGAKRLNLNDTSTSLPCEWNGKWCCDEALMDLRMTSVFIKGQSYYETLGAITEDPEFRKAARFLNEMPILSLCSELSKLPSGSIWIHLVKDICLALDLYAENLTIGGLSNALYNAGKGNEYAHQLWHRFHDLFIAEKNSFFIPFLLQQESIDKELLDIVKSEVDGLIQQGLDIKHLESDFTEIRLNAALEKLSRFSLSPALFLMNRASEQCLRNTARDCSPVQNHPALYHVYTMPPRECPQPKSLLEQWILAKHKIRKTKHFTFAE